MATLIIRPAGEPDWVNAVFLSGSLPITAVDAAGLGIIMGVDYEIGILGDLATFQVTDVPGAMAAPTLTPGIDQIEVALPAGPITGGSTITGYTLRYRTGAASWTTITDITSPHTIIGLAEETTFEVQVCAENGNGQGPWSPSASATTPSSGDTTAPVVNAISYSAPNLTVDLTEASGAATAVWATADVGEAPIFTVGGGWSGTTYESGSFAVSSGGYSDTISLTTATPSGGRELSLYFYDAEDNLSVVERIAFSVPSVATLSRVNDVSGGTSTVNTSEFETASITIGSESNRALVASIAFQDNAANANLSNVAATFGSASRTPGTGTAMTLFGPFTRANDRTTIYFAVLLNPPTGAGTVQVRNPGDDWGSIGCWLSAFENADQTIGNWNAFGTGASSGTSISTSGTVADGVLLSTLILLSGDYSAQIGAGSGATLDGAAASGTSGLSDHTNGFAYEAGVAAGTHGHSFTWTTSVQNAAATLSIPEA